MTATSDSGLGHGTGGKPQADLEEQTYPNKNKDNEENNSEERSKKYKPSPKHDPGHGWGSENPIKNNEEGQKLLDEGIQEGKQVYNITDGGKIVKFQPDQTPENGYHSYEVFSSRDIPSSVLRQLYERGKLSRSEYNKFRRGKKGRRK